MFRHLWQVGFLAVFTVLMLLLLQVTAPAVYLFVVGVAIMGYAVVWAWLRASPVHFALVPAVLVVRVAGHN